MTYQGGIEDGKAALATQILNILAKWDLSSGEKVYQITTLCNDLKINPNKPQHATLNCGCDDN